MYRKLSPGLIQDFKKGWSHVNLFPADTGRSINMLVQRRWRFRICFTYRCKPSEHDPLIQCCVNAGPPSPSSAEHLSSIGSMYRVCWEQCLILVFVSVFPYKLWPDGHLDQSEAYDISYKHEFGALPFR